MKKKIAIAVLTAAFITCFVVTARAQEPERVKFTCYTEPTFKDGMITASGEKLREGIIASSREHLGDCAMLYLIEEDGSMGDFIGYYEALDVGGTEAIRNNQVVDVYRARYSDAKYMMLITSGEVYVVWVEQPQG